MPIRGSAVQIKMFSLFLTATSAVGKSPTPSTLGGSPRGQCVPSPSAPARGSLLCPLRPGRVPRRLLACAWGSLSVFKARRLHGGAGRRVRTGLPSKAEPYSVRGHTRSLLQPPGLLAPRGSCGDAAVNTGVQTALRDGAEFGGLWPCTCTPSLTGRGAVPLNQSPLVRGQAGVLESPTAANAETPTLSAREGCLGLFPPWRRDTEAETEKLFQDRSKEPLCSMASVSP